MRSALLLVLAILGVFAPARLRAAEPITLRLSVWDGNIALETIRGLVARFERENPDIRVKVENYADYAAYHQKMLITYAAGVAPDVAMMDPANVQRLAKRKALRALDPFYARTPGFDIKAYYPEIVKAHSYQGISYVLPRDIAPMGLIYYDKQAFEEAGLGDPKTYDDKWTFDTVPRPELGRLDFLTVCAKLMKKDRRGKTVRWAYTSGWPELAAQAFGLSMGGELVDDPESPTRVRTTEKPWIAGYQLAYDLIAKYGYMPSSTDTSAVLQSTTQQMFARRQVAMYQNGIWEVPNMRDGIKPGSKNYFRWDIARAPAYLNPGGKPVFRQPSGGSGYAIFSSTKYPEESWRLTRFLAGPIGMTAMAKAGIAQPAIRSLALTPGVWLPGPDTPPAERDPENRIATDQAVMGSYWPLRWENASALTDRFTKGLESVWTGQKPPAPIMRANAVLAADRLAMLRKDEGLPPFPWLVGLAVGLAIVAGIVLWVRAPSRGELEARGGRRRLSRTERGEARSAYLFLSPWIIGLAVFTLGPMILSLLMAFADWDIIQPARYRGLGNFVEAFTADPSFYPSLKATFKYTILAVPLGIIGSLSLALLLNQKVRGVAVYRAMYYIPSIASVVAASLIWRKIFNPDTGLLNRFLYGAEGNSAFGMALSRWAETPGKPVDWLGNENTALYALVIMSLWGVGGGMVIFLAGLQGIPANYYEAATLDGAGTLGRFRNVTLPLLTPTIFFTLVTGLIGTLQVFTQAYVLTGGGPNDATRFFVFHLYANAFQSVRMGYASALGWILFVIVMIFTYLQFKGSKWVYYEADAK